jgi:hypothetical protein
MRQKRRAESGLNVIQLVGILFITLLVSAIPIDLGYYFAMQNRLQTAADSAALAAVAELYRSTALDPGNRLNDAKNAALVYISYNEPDSTLGDDDIQFGFIDPGSRRYDPNNFSIPTSNPHYSMTKGFNSVFIRLDRSKNGINSPLRTIMGNFFGVFSMNAEAHSIAMMEQTVNAIDNGGLRPILACEGQIRKAMEDGILENNLVRIYEDRLEIDGVSHIADCPPPGSGNWAFANLDDSFSGGEPVDVHPKIMGEWLASGYQGRVKADNEYRTRRGDFFAEVAPLLDSLIDNRVVFPIPFYRTWKSSGGTGSKARIAGFVGFQITGYKISKPKAARYQTNQYIEGHFQRYVCNKGCSSDNSGHFSTLAGAVVKFRLAPR